MNSQLTIHSITMDKKFATVVLSDGTCLKVTVLCLLRHNLCVDKQVDYAQLLQWKQETDQETALNRAMEYMKYGNRTQKQMWQYLSGRFEPDICTYVIDKLKEYDYINDSTYAQQYICTNSATKGKRLLQQQLLHKGVGMEDVQNALQSIEDESSSAQLCAKKFMRGRDISLKSLAQLNRHLLGRGFDFDVTNEVVGQYKQQLQQDD